MTHGVYLGRINATIQAIRDLGDERCNSGPAPAIFDLMAGVDRLRKNRELVFCPAEDVLYAFARGQLAKHLAFTVMVPAGKAVRALEAVRRLDTIGLLDSPEKTPAVKWCPYAAELIRSDVRFHNQKATRLYHALLRLPDFMRTMVNMTRLPEGHTLAEEVLLENAHDWLQAHVEGLGPKATAHFMRNAGLFSDEFAYPIIDVHIHKVLAAFGYPHDTYGEAETSFRKFAESRHVPIIELDAALWCAYSSNWDITNTDFNNFDVEWPT